MNSTSRTPNASPRPLHVRDFADCRNIAHGAAFIIVSGSSAKDFPIEQFADIPMITVNGAISMFTGTGIKPFFYACTDTSFSLQQPELFAYAMRTSQRVAVWANQAQELIVEPTGDLYLLKKAPKPTLTEWLLRNNQDLVRNRAVWGSRNRSIGFSKNLAHGFFDARTVLYLALQLAYHAGFSRVILVGADMNQSAGRFYETDGSSISPCGLDQHFHSRILPSLKLMSDKVVGKEFAVYNLSPSSRIPSSVIPVKTLDEVKAIIQT